MGAMLAVDCFCDEFDKEWEMVRVGGGNMKKFKTSDKKSTTQTL